MHEIGEKITIWIADISHRISEWPPEYRCENCGWWRRYIPSWPFRRQSRLGFCTNLKVHDHSSEHYVCHLHTAGAEHDLGPSLRAVEQRGRRALRKFRQLK
jgi:hypothetical protein